MLKMNLQLSLIKGVGSTKNSRLESKRLGAKRADGQFVKLEHSVQTAWHKDSSGLNVGRGGDDTLFATADGIVRF